jgi:NhaP-type Na+/H+ or K+/H+ antiporter
MIGYIILVIIISVIVSIITERLFIRKLKLEEGIQLKNGRCILKEGYGKLN